MNIFNGFYIYKRTFNLFLERPTIRVEAANKEKVHEERAKEKERQTERKRERENKNHNKGSFEVT